MSDDFGYEYLDEHSMLQLYIDDFSIDVFFQSIDRKIVRLFNELSITKLTRKQKDTRQMSGGQKHPSDEQIVELFGFSSKSIEVKDRLDVLGYTLEMAEKDFYKSKQTNIDYIDHYGKISQESAYNNDSISPNYPDQGAFETRNKEKLFLINLNFNDYLDSIKEIISGNLRRVLEPQASGKGFKSIIPRDISNVTTRHLVCNGFHAIQFSDNLNLLRCVLNEFSTGQITYEGEGIPKKAFEQYHSKNFSLTENDIQFDLKTIILTEGKTDKHYIETTLMLFYPHLMDLFYFLDFDVKNGSAKVLREVTKSLVASGIPNRVIALFDNDISGISQRDGLLSDLQNLPDNLRVFTYPNNNRISYPVKDKKSGIVNHIDINSKGAAIESYLPDDLLLDKNGNFVPLVINPDGQLSFGKGKKQVTREFNEKIKDNIINEEWSNMFLILDVIRKAFNG